MLKPTRYESVHTVSIVDATANDAFREQLRQSRQADLEERVTVLIEADGEIWRARLKDSALWCWGPTPERAKQALADSLRKITAELA